MRLFDALLRQRRLVYLAVAMLSAAGIDAAFRLPSSIYPERSFPRIVIVAQGSALGGRQMVFSVTRPLEEAVSIVPGVERIRSRTIRGGAELSIFFSPNTDMAAALQLVQARVSQIQSGLPPGVTLDVERMLPSLFPILTYNLVGADPAVLFDIARNRIKPVLSRIPGVGRVDVLGSDVREIEVIADPARLATLGIRYDDLASAIRKATGVAPVGRVAKDYQQFLLISDHEAHTPGEIAGVVIRGTTRVGDVATVEAGTEDRVRLVAGDGRPGVLINISRQPGGSTLAVADSVAKQMRALERTPPPGRSSSPCTTRPCSFGTRSARCATPCSSARCSPPSCSCSSCGEDGSPPSPRRASRSRWRSPPSGWACWGRPST